MNMEAQRQAVTLFDFGAGGAAPWSPQDDGVMGGRSRSQFRVAGGLGVFEGYVSLENNGGFCSVRSPAGDFRLGGFDGIELRLRGDGKRYGFNLRAGGGWGFNRARYERYFETQAGVWQQIVLPFDQLLPTVMGTIVGPAGADARRVAQFGFIIQHKQAGRFRLEIESIRAVRGGVDYWVV
jgi:hypothetical protein